MIVIGLAIETLPDIVWQIEIATTRIAPLFQQPLSGPDLILCNYNYRSTNVKKEGQTQPLYYAQKINEFPPVLDEMTFWYIMLRG